MKSTSLTLRIIVSLQKDCGLHYSKWLKQGVHYQEFHLMSRVLQLCLKITRGEYRKAHNMGKLDIQNIQNQKVPALNPTDILGQALEPKHNCGSLRRSV